MSFDQLNIKLIYLLMFSMALFSANAQEKPVNKSVYIVEGLDTVPVLNLSAVNITGLAPEYLKNMKDYYRLRFNVIKVYPYARMAAIKLKELNDSLALMPDNKARKRFTKEFEKQLRKDFEAQVENLTVNQGKIFIKLIDRETGNTSYDLIKDVKGSFNAFVLQTAARLFGHNLKNKYDPEGEDKVIESIVRQIESGEIN